MASAGPNRSRSRRFRACVREMAEEAGVRKRKRDGGEVEAEGGVYEKHLLEGEGCCEGIAEEAVEEVMRWLEAEISDAPLAESDAGFVTINGNEESCGPSFSAAASTVMASVDTRAGAPPLPAVPWPWPFPEATHDPEQEVDAETCDADEEWLVQLLTCVPALEVEGVL
ncbi:uncharacterized protein LOC133913904 [Phragmites australis]|uniref:uncharacterized protein LOC133913904 n=1 Tax=Phragmites australis TaxID=29695 RepID=UPI002D78D3A0|nr:uncharacterized protein LOC133913904 [Phragmites australis]